MEMGRQLTKGVDVWLNTPRRPKEASGTSGMKAAMNGGLNLSILDGWWPEGYDGKNGWSSGMSIARPIHDRMHSDLDALCFVLEQYVFPVHSMIRNSEGVPPGWVRMMRAAIAPRRSRLSSTATARSQITFATTTGAALFSRSRPPRVESLPLFGQIQVMDKGAEGWATINWWGHVGYNSVRPHWVPLGNSKNTHQLTRFQAIARGLSPGIQYRYLSKSRYASTRPSAKLI